jgi:hypothetical protein
MESVFYRSLVYLALDFDSYTHLLAYIKFILFVIMKTLSQLHGCVCLSLCSSSFAGARNRSSSSKSTTQLSDCSRARQECFP